ncbi:hypothetical protein [Azotobacter beijerinckii]|uniref:Plasmid segregation centromere-binding protein ParG n=1 Tax=Azotobacter beijerinckii TaxID=170623 RepID=A0A1I4IS95_9GAMM|nr:hypothetical protein [Azotobacter beijerinckii]SFL57239.1 hypothetical protein SAMN04244574_04682 [Azotobacter beijerinckii]
MAIKPPSARAGVQQGGKPVPSSEDVDRLVRELADKPYGEVVELEAPKRIAKPKPITISLPDVMIEQLEDQALQNKRSGKGPKTISALIREQLEKAGYKSQL